MGQVSVVILRTRLLEINKGKKRINKCLTTGVCNIEQILASASIAVASIGLSASTRTTYGNLANDSCLLLLDCAPTVLRPSSLLQLPLSPIFSHLPIFDGTLFWQG